MTIVILAAGAASRMGRPKLLLPIDGRPMIARVIAAAEAWPIVVVAGRDVASALARANVRIVRNDEPERGMSHSLRLGDEAVTADGAIAVLLGDLADITSTAVATAIDSYDEAVDIVIPRCGTAFAHPVIFGPRARRKISTLPPGDSIKALRDDPSLRRRIVETEASALIDLDTPDDYARRTERGKGTQRSLR